MTGPRRALPITAAAVCLFLAACSPAARETAVADTRSSPAPSGSVPAEAGPAEAGPAEAGPASPAGWKTVEHRGVRVDVPLAWQRLDKTGCEFRAEQWAPAGTSPCRPEQGVVFYTAATFDPKNSPEVQKTEAKTWAGYVHAGDFAVYVSGSDRDLVQEVLDSASPPS